MKYKDIEIGSNSLHMIATDKFKTITIQVILKQPVERENITKMNLLTAMILEGTKKYPTKRLLTIEGENLYNTLISTACYRLGSFSNINIQMTLLNEKYTEVGMLNKSLELLSEIIFDSNVTDNSFNEQAFKIVVEETKKQLKSEKESHDAYSIIRLLENMSSNEMFSYRDSGYIEEVDNITSESLKEYYDKTIKNSYYDIYILGDIDFSEIEKLVRKYFNIVTFKKEKASAFLDYKQVSKGGLTVKESEIMNQSKLAISCKVKATPGKELNYVFNIYNIILGAGPDSKFFKNIREKHSLAYYISASMKKLDNLIILKAGIDACNFDKTVKLIKQEMLDMEKGNFTDGDLANAKAAYKNKIDEIDDSPEALIESCVAIDLLKADPLSKRNKEIDKVEREDIINFAKKISIDTIYLLEGVEESNEED